MREILFRGKTEDGVWVKGSYVYSHNWKRSGKARHFITNFYGDNKVLVTPETVGQFTGLTDKNDTKIFEGDIVKVCKDGDILEIIYCKGGYFCANNNAWWEFIDDLGDIEVIGNIYDNADLLKGVEQ